MSMAQSLGGNGQESPQESENGSSFPEIDLGMLQKLSGFASQGNIDSQEKCLLQALNPYLSHRRLQKLENAMRAAASQAAVAIRFITDETFRNAVKNEFNEKEE